MNGAHVPEPRSLGPERKTSGRGAPRILERIGKLSLPLILIAVFFSAFIVVLNATFPHGVSLSSMVRYGGLMGDGSMPSNPQFPADRSAGEPGPAPEPLVARMLTIDRTVRHRSPSSVVWSRAYEGMPLENRSAVQTLASSHAVLDFEGESRLRLGENTLAVVRKFERDPVSKEKRAVILVLNGELRGSIAPHRGDKLHVQVNTATAEGRIEGPSAAAGQEAVFRVSENPDHSLTFSVYQGSAAVTAAGRTVQVRTGHTVTVHPNRPLGDPTALLQPPVPVEPQNNEQRVYRLAPPRVEFEWGSVRKGSSYRFEIARDGEFRDLVHHDEFKPNHFYHGNLAEGNYWWRVAVVQDWAESMPSTTRRFRVVRDVEPPPLSVDFPNNGVPAAPMILTGMSEPGARIFMANQEVMADERGAFELMLALKPGIHTVVVEAMDAAGNVSHSSVLLTAESR